MRLWLEIDVPICGLRPTEARDFQESLPIPPPSTVAGMLLSLLGVELSEAARFGGNRIGLRVAAGVSRSTILRKMRRDPKEKPKGGAERNPQFRPEYQEVLTDLRFWTLLDDSGVQAPNESLVQAVRSALENPAGTHRYGALSLGESAFMVDALAVVEAPASDSLGVCRDDAGRYRLSLWVDRDEPTKYRWGRFELRAGELQESDLCVVFGSE